MNMKRIIILVNTLLVSALLVACGTSNTSSGNTSNSQSSSGNDKKIIEFNKVLVDDDYVTIELLNFYESKKGENTDACITFSVTNHLNRDILFNVNDTYVDDQSVVDVMLDGNSGPEPDKTKEYGYEIQKKIAGDYIPLDSFDDLYRLNGTFEILVYSEDGKYLVGDKTRTYTFDFHNLK